MLPEQTRCESIKPTNLPCLESTRLEGHQATLLPILNVCSHSPTNVSGTSNPYPSYRCCSTRLANMSGMSGAIRDASRAGADSPDRSPSSAYVPSSSAPWLAGGAAAAAGGAAGAAGSAGTGSYNAPASGGGGSSWWDKHSATTDTQPAAAASSGWGAKVRGAGKQGETKRWWFVLGPC